MAATYLLVMWCPVQSRRESDPGFRAELENLAGSAKRKGTSGRTARPKVSMGPSGADCSAVLRRRRNFRGGSRPPALGSNWVNWKQEELAGFDGRRQPSLGGTSRMNREVHVRNL